MRDGQPVESREAVERRDRLIASLASLPPVHGALDQIVQRFGTDLVAEVTGRSRRIVRKTAADGISRLVVENRAGSANLAETQAFMDDAKRILVFSDAGGTIQGLGRTNRTNQVQPPLFRPIATNVKAEKRFLSTIARRLDTLGAITKGQRQTGGQGLFRPEDNLESAYARDALRQLYQLIAAGRVEHCPLQAFEDATGLKLTDSNGLRDDLPPITTFLNRLLALTIALQNILFTAFDQLLTARIEGAVASGTYDAGLETLRAASFVVKDRSTIYTHPTTGAQTRLLTITRRDRNQPVTLDDALGRLSDPRAVLLLNTQSGRAAVQLPARSLMTDDGEVERRVRLLRPMEQPTLGLAAMAQTCWQETDRATFVRAWSAEVTDVPEFTDSEIHIVAGLLLPIWKKLPQDSTRVFRLQTDDGERIVGRKVPPHWVAETCSDAPVALSPAQAFAALLSGNAVLDLAEGLQLRRTRIMNVPRIELTGFTDAMRDRLGAFGLFHEIITWKLRMFVPTDSAGSDVLSRLLGRFPLVRIAQREAA
jgi:hypothetical protein